MVKAQTGHIIGATYFSTYWRKHYQVIGVASVLNGTDNGVQVLWEDGRTTYHCTHVGDSKLVKEPQYT